MTKQSALLIPSTNGLGHARRLIHLVKNWKEFSRFCILLTKQQHLLLEAELSQILDVNFQVEILIYKGIGLDGFKHLDNPIHPENLDRNIVSELKRSKFVFSDNCIWPLYYRRDIILIGHFLWHDVLPLSNLSGKKLTEDVLGFEKKLLEDMRNTFGLEAFTFGKMLSIVEKKKILLPAYFNVDNGRTINEEIWHSQGTTGLNMIDSNEFSQLNVIPRETHRLKETLNLPKGVIGRPGLGTIRDCIEFQVPFFPAYSGADIELNNNAEVFEGLPGMTNNILVNGQLYKFRRILKEGLIGETSFSELSAKLS
jgi:hypothetical protein